MWIVLESIVKKGIFYDQRLGIQDGVCAEGVFSYGLADSDSQLRFEPLVAVVDKADHSDWDLKNALDRGQNLVVGQFGRSTQDRVAMQFS